ncbi:MFS transporter [Nonomuraea roseoviolacea]|uniref:GPH family glycoside/pentoside/hexuronide:cation symporter n=1 Tax=Nonomuraea roseoviolacea subsp. carminata TaxID=160689 RepID=A0ABT1K4M5_9ACTN|nr:MFS transporter [Nonomuraea roseoviolacea]MCP2348820.1 GPH family glycoside/pentoside/hexuronide:cation symporter [Nonomuraea roseoviolacea subsp. carminata]
MIATPTGVPTVSRGVRLGYGVGSFCTATFNAVPGLLLLYYMTNFLAVPAWLAGAVVAAPKVWDLVINPLVGRWSDRTTSRLGPRRPWLLAGACTLPVAFVLVFAGPPLTGVPAALYVGACFMAAATGYALFEVPYKAMPAEMTGDYHERTSLLQWRMVFIGAATVISGIVAPAIVNSDGHAGTLDSYRLMAVTVASVLLASMLGSFFGTARAPMTGAPEPDPGSLREQFAAARGNAAFVWLLALSCLQMMAVSMLLAGAPYFAAYILDDPKTTSTLFAVFVGPMLLAMPAWVWLARRYDKRGAMILAGLLFGGGTLANLATPLFGSWYAHTMLLVVGLGYAGVQLLEFSMLADVIAVDAETTGRRRAGVFTGLWTAIESGVSSFGALIFGGVLTLGGFVESDAGRPVAQPDSAVTAVLVGETAIPALVLLLAVLMTLKYRLRPGGAPVSSASG